jgi:hypothetical protein
MDVSGQPHAPAAIFPTKESQYTLDRGWMDPRAGLVEMEKLKFLILLGLKLRLLRCQACSQSRMVHDNGD